MAITKSTSFDNNKLKDITFVDIFSEEYKDNYRIFTNDHGEIIFYKYYGLTFDEALENYFMGYSSSYNINFLFSIIKYCLENSKIIDTKTNSEVARYTPEQVNFCLIALTEGFDYRDCYIDNDMDKTMKVFNVMKEHKKEVKHYLQYDGSSRLLHYAILTDKNIEPLVGSHFWEITHDGEYFTDTMYRLGYDIRKDEKGDIYLFKDSKCLCSINERIIDEYFVDKIPKIPEDMLVYYISGKVNSNAIEAYVHLSKYCNVTIEDVSFLNCEILENLLELDKDGIDKYVYNLLLDIKKKYTSIQNLYNKLNSKEKEG